MPGKSAVQSFSQFNGKNGCSFCEEEGEVVPVGKGHSRVYPYKPGPPKQPRTKDSVFQQGLLSQQQGTPVIFLKIYFYTRYKINFAMGCQIVCKITPLMMYILQPFYSIIVEKGFQKSI